MTDLGLNPTYRMGDYSVYRLPFIYFKMHSGQKLQVLWLLLQGCFDSAISLKLLPERYQRISYRRDNRAFHNDSKIKRVVTRIKN